MRKEVYMNKLKIVSLVVMGLGIVGNILSNYADSIAREDMKKEILNELRGENGDS